MIYYESFATGNAMASFMNKNGITKEDIVLLRYNPEYSSYYLFYEK